VARLPDELVERLKREIAIERLVESRGIALKRAGRNLMGLCPFHNDHNPSLSITPSTNKWHCLGCGKGGTVIDWVMQIEGVSFRHAAELLRQNHVPLAADPSAKPPRLSTVPKLPAPVERNADDRVLLLQVVNYYHETLKQSPDALKYLESRGLQSAEMIERFRLGFSNRTLGYRLPHRNRETGAELRGRLQKIGILRESGHEHFNGSVVIPLFDSSGEVVQMYGRKITRSLRDGTPLHLYLPGAHRGVWNETALEASKDIILCEALIDALTFWCAGYRNVTTSYGVNGFTEEIKAAFRKHGTKRIYIAYDRDEAGDHAAEEHSVQLMEMGIECFRVQFPKGMDANEYARTTQPAAKALGLLLNSALWLGKGKRPAAAVIEPVKEVREEEPPQQETMEEQPTEPAVIEQKPEPAAKEENAISLPTLPILPMTTAENVLPLAAPSSAAEETRPVVLPGTDVPTEIRGDEIWLTLGERRYRVLGLEKNTSMGVLRVNVMVTAQNTRGEISLHVDMLDLYGARQRTAYAKQAGAELGIKEEIIERDLRRVLLKLETLQREQLKKTLEPEETKIEMTAEEKAAALNLLRDPRLLDRVLLDFEKCGMVGEETNKIISYLAAVSRLMETPLAILVQSSSAAGKTSLMEAVLALVPEEQQVQYSAMTGQALFYLGEKELKHKVLAVVEEEGAQRAAYALKLLQSEGVLTIASTGKDPNTGRLLTHQYRVEGPVMIFLTTTAIEMDEELLNRSIVLTVNEDAEQTKAIHQKQREAQTREGLWARQQRIDILKVHRNAQRLLRPVHVVNEHAPALTFPYSRTRTRRDHTKFLTLINAIALLYQHQRPIQTETRNGKTIEYIEATEQDVELARQLVNQVLPPSLDDVPAQTRRLLLEVDKMVSEECARQQIERADYRFSRRAVRHYTQAGDSVLKKHLHRLEELEYLIVHRGGRGQSFVYELDFEADEHGNPVVPGLGCIYDEKKSRQNGQLSRSSRAQVAGVARVVTMAETRASAGGNGDFSQNLENSTVRGDGEETPIVVVGIANGATKPNGGAAHSAVKRAGVN
jgi:DNA primase